MMKHLIIAIILALMMVVSVSAATSDPVLINELLASHTGIDDTEYIELFGTPGYNLYGLSLIAVEGHTGESQGMIDFRLDFGTSDALGANSFFLIGNPIGLSDHYGVAPNVSITTNSLENSSFTMALVQTDSLSGAFVTDSEIILDAVGLNDGSYGDTFYFGAPEVGPDGYFFPAGARRIVDGFDTDTVDDWVFADFNLGSNNTPTPGTIIPAPGALILAATGMLSATLGLKRLRRKHQE